MPRKIVKSKIYFENNVIETIAEVPVEKYESMPPNDKLKYIGKEIPRIDGYDKVSGADGYTFDIVLPRMVHAKILRSPYANAKIKNIDTKKPKSLTECIIF